jgi:hypothetical protein
MEKVSLDTWLQRLGMLGVMASLVFVGLEMRQSQRIALVSQIQQRSYAASAEAYTFTEAGLDWFSSKFSIPTRSELTTEQIAARNSENVSWFFYEADYFQYSQGLMTEAIWQAKLRAMKVNLKRCEYPEIYQMRSKLVEIEFKKILDSMPSRCTAMNPS